jgi:hypothetical protein
LRSAVFGVDINAADPLRPNQRAFEPFEAQDRRAARGPVRACAGTALDLILFNPPFLRGEPLRARDRATGKRQPDLISIAMLQFTVRILLGPVVHGRK